MTAAPQSIQPICAAPAEDLIDLAGEVELARDAFLNAIGTNAEEFRRERLADILWNDKGTFAPALRQAAEAASLKARVEELEATLKWIEARDRMWTAPEYEKGNEVLERGPHNIKIRGSYGAAANLVLKRAALTQSSTPARGSGEP